MTRAPPWGALPALTEPPCISTMRCAIDSPRPVPPARPVTKGRNTLGRSSARKPGPVSRTVLSIQRRPSASFRMLALTTTSPPWGVWRIALWTTFWKTWAIRCGSTTTSGSAADTSFTTVTFPAAAAGSLARMASATTLRRLTAAASTCGGLP